MTFRTDSREGGSKALNLNYSSRPPMKTPVFSSAILLPVLMLIPCMPLSADWYGDWEYEDSTIIGYRGEGGVVTVPNQHSSGEIFGISLDGNDNITGIVVSEGIENVYIRTFSNLTYISIPSTVTSFKYFDNTRILLDCQKLSQIEVHADNTNYKSINGILYSKSGTRLLRYPAGRTGTYSFPSETNSVAPDAFHRAQYLSQIVIPSRFEYLEANTFYYATGLTTVTFETFWNPVSHTWYGLQELDGAVFPLCLELTSVTLPRTLNTIDGIPFSGCYNLEAIGVDPNNPDYASVDGILYNKALTTLIECPGGKTSVTEIPPTVTSINESAFNGCMFLLSVRLPSSLTSIGASSFFGCSNLYSIRIPSAVTSIGSKAFGHCSALASAYFSGTVAPTIALDSFETTAALFQISFRAGSSDYTTPYWYGYPCASIPNSAPVLTGIGNRTIQIGQTLTFTVQASDANEDDLEFSAAGTAP